MIGWLVPSTDDRLNLGSGTAAASPFVIAIQNAGIKGLPSVGLHFFGGHIISNLQSNSSSMPVYLLQRGPPQVLIYIPLLGLFVGYSWWS